MVLNNLDPIRNPDNEENSVLVHNFISAEVNEHIGKVPNGDHKSFKTFKKEYQNHITDESITNFLNNCPCAGQKVTKEDAQTSDTETPHVDKTKVLGTQTKETVGAQELVKSNVKEKMKNKIQSMGKVNFASNNTVRAKNCM